jgi:hypothetical protein
LKDDELPMEPRKETLEYDKKPPTKKVSTAKKPSKK